MMTLSADCSLHLEAQASIAVHNPLSQVDIPVLIVSLQGLESGTQDGLVIALDVEADILGCLREV
jgi:hypothetical protein